MAVNRLTVERATVGGGCFWCLEAVYQEIDGVTSVTSGYAGGKQGHPTYEQVSGGTTGHAEVVQVEFDPAVISYREILEILWVVYDPTMLNRQGADVGTQYRSIILYENEEQRREAEAAKTRIQKLWSDPVVTEVVPLPDFYPAESYHRDYYRRYPNRLYCQMVINPKLKKLREKFASRIRKAPR